MKTGDPISPSTGYRSDALERTTACDRSLGQCLADEQLADQVNPLVNPRANAINIVVGAAAPLRMPLIGPPVPFR